MGNRKVTIAIIAAIVIIAIVVSFPSTTVAKKIEKDPKFHYTTSLTSHYSYSDRANVYTTEMSVPDTARYIIREKRPMSYTDLNNEESINLTYDDHYVLVYKGDLGKTYVQVSSRKYIHQNGYYGLYRPYHPNVIVFYDDVYRGYGYYRTDTGRYGGGGYYSRTKTVPVYGTTNSGSQSKSNVDNKDSTKIKTDQNNSSKIKTGQNDSNKIRTNSSTSSGSKSSTGSGSKSSLSKGFGSIRSGSSGSRSSFGGGTSFGK